LWYIFSMSVVTIPKQLTGKDELVVIPKREYRELLIWKNRMFKEVKPTKDELKAIERGRKEISKGNFVTLSQFKKELGF